MAGKKGMKKGVRNANGGAPKNLMMPGITGIAGASGAVDVPVVQHLAAHQPPALEVAELPVAPAPSVNKGGRGAALQAPEARAKAQATRSANAARKKEIIAKALAEAGLSKKARVSPEMRMANKMAEYHAEGKKFTAGMRRAFAEGAGDIEEIKAPRRRRVESDAVLRAADRLAKKAAAGTSRRAVVPLLRAEKKEYIEKLKRLNRSIAARIVDDRADLKELRERQKDIREVIRAYRAAPLSEFEDRSGLPHYDSASDDEY
jgi:hypothetical protein